MKKQYGITAIEYMLLSSILALSIIFSLNQIGPVISEFYKDLNKVFTSESSGCPDNGKGQSNSKGKCSK